MSMSHHVRSFRLPVLAGLLALGACSVASPYHPQATPQHADARVTVQNPQWEDLTIYVDRGGARIRLGVVPGNTTKTLTVPDALMSTNALIRLVAQSSGRTVRGVSNSFALAPGSRASWAVGITGTTTPVAMVPSEAPSGSP